MGDSTQRKLNKREKRQQRQEELLKNFEGDFYQEKKVGEKWFVKTWNGNTERWQVSVYSQESFFRYKDYSDKTARYNYQMEKEE